MFGFDDMLIGAAIGGGLNLLTGRNPIQGAAIGGIGGGLLGGLKNASFLQNAAAKPVLTEASLGMPSTAFYEAGGVGMGGANTLSSMGLNQTPYGTFIDPSSYTNIFGNPMYKGGQGVLSNAWDEYSPYVKEYATPQNLMGVANLMSTQNPPPQQFATASGGGVKPGSIQGLNVNFGGAKVIKRRGYA